MSTASHKLLLISMFFFTFSMLEFPTYSLCLDLDVDKLVISKMFCAAGQIISLSYFTFDVHIMFS